MSIGLPSGGGGGTIDAVARTEIRANTPEPGEIFNATNGPDTGLDTGFVYRGTVYVNATGADVTVPVTVNKANLLAAGFTPPSEASDPEVIENAGPLAGLAPAGAKLGIDTTNDRTYKVVAGNWVIVPQGSSIKAFADSTDLMVAEFGDYITHKPGHEIDLTSLTTGQWITAEIIDDHTGNEGSFEVGAGGISGDTSFGIGIYTIHALGANQFYRHYSAGGGATSSDTAVNTDYAAQFTAAAA